MSGTSRMDRKVLVKIVSAIFRNLPRVKGLGIIISMIASQFMNDDVQLERSVFGNKMRLRTNDLIGRCLIFMPNYFDKVERKIIKKIVTPGDYVVDLGANIGAYTLLLAELVGSSGHVDAVEAEEFNAGELRHNVALNKAHQVTIHQVGVSDKNEILSLMLNTTGNAGGHSFYDQSHIPDPEIQEISCIPLSTITQSRRAKFIKLDIEGFEHRVLQRFFEDVPKTAWPQYLMLEDNPERREADAVQLCVENGYEVFKIVNLNVFLRISR